MNAVSCLTQKGPLPSCNSSFPSRESLQHCLPCGPQPWKDRIPQPGQRVHCFFLGRYSTGPVCWMQSSHPAHIREVHRLAPWLLLACCTPANQNGSLRIPFLHDSTVAYNGSNTSCSFSDPCFFSFLHTMFDIILDTLRKTNCRHAQHACQ